jgi:hypothetical protein
MDDAASASLYQSPELAALYDKWFTQPIPPKGVNLDIPMRPGDEASLREANGFAGSVDLLIGNARLM